jgi:predicted nucleotidyltransferase
MLTTLEAVIQRLIDAYDPERIILFGSHATGGPRKKATSIFSS